MTLLDPENPYRQIGWVELHDAANHFLLVHSFRVNEPYRKKGYGRKLLQASVQFAQSKATHRYLMGFVARDNKASQKCFESAGFTKSGFIMSEDEHFGEQWTRSIVNKNPLGVAVRR